MNELRQYVPILKARRGEFGAVENMNDDERSHTLPFLRFLRFRGTMPTICPQKRLTSTSKTWVNTLRHLGGLAERALWTSGYFTRPNGWPAVFIPYGQCLRSFVDAN